MRLRKKTILSIFVVLVTLIGIFELVLSNVLLHRFGVLENESMHKDIARAQKALLGEARQLTVKAHDWSSWDDSYQYVEDLNEDYAQSNLQGSTLENMRIEDVQFYSTSGAFVSGVQYLMHGRKHEEGIHKQFIEAFAARKRLQQFDKNEAEDFRFHEGFLRLPSGIVMFAAQPILPSDGEGPAKGTIVFTKVVDDELIKKVADQAELALDLVRLDEQGHPDALDAPPVFASDSSTSQRILDDKTILGFGLVRDTDGAPSFVLRIREARDIYHQGIVTLRFLFLALVALGAVVCLLIAFLLERLVIARLQHLCEQISAIASVGDSTARVEISGKDELAIVCRAINTMLEALNESEKNLRLAKEAAESATRARSQFVANISHELRTPINGVLGMAQVLAKLPLGANERQYVEMIHKASLSLLGIINDVLDFSKIDAGKLELEEVVFPLRETLYECLQSIASRAQEKGLELISNVSPELPDQLLGDPLRLRQVILNLCGNAIKFTEHGEVEVAVRLEERRGQNLKLHFVIRDTGIGIAQDKLANVFEAFTQADGSTARKYGGTGLGLTISKDLVQLMGGSIWAESDLGVGTEFHFTGDFPVSPSVESSPSLDLRQQNVVVIDDCATFRSMLAREIEHRGGGSHCFSALEEIWKQPFSVPTLFVVDAEQPKAAALSEVILKLRDNGHRVVLTCSLVRSDILQSAQECWQVPVVLKPLLVENLLSCFFNEDRSASALARPEPSGQQQPLAVLVADDVALNREVLRLMLEPMGHRVISASSGREVLELLEKNHFDILLLDSQMPEMDGPETALKIREKEARSQGSVHLPIVAVTANALEGDRERLLEAGMDEYLSKPVFMDQLASVLIKLCGLDEKGSSRTIEQNNICLTPCLNLNDLLLRLGGKPHLALEMIELFIEEREELMENLVQAVRSGVSEKIRRSAHALKGSLANINACLAADVAGEIEEIAAGKRPGDASEQLKRLQASVITLDHEIGKALQELR